MQDSTTPTATEPARKAKRIIVGVIAGGVITSGLAFGAVSANAATTSTGTAATATATDAPARAARATGTATATGST